MSAQMPAPGTKLSTSNSASHSTNSSADNNTVMGVATSSNKATVIPNTKEDMDVHSEAANKLKKLTLSGHTDKVTCVTNGFDEDTIISASDDKTIKIWSLRTGQCLHTFTGHTSSVKCLSRSDDLLASGSGGGIIKSDDTVRIWSLKDKKCLNIFSGHKARINSVDLNSKYGIVISGSGNGFNSEQVVRVWSLKDEKCIANLIGHNHWVNTVALSNDAKIIVSGGYDKILRVWSLEDNECVKKLNDSNSHCNSIIIDGDMIISAHGSGDLFSEDAIKIWSIQSEKCLRKFEGHKSKVTSLSLSVDKQILVSGSLDKTVRVWSMKTGECLKIITLSSYIYGITQFIKDNQLYIVAACEDYNLYFQHAYTMLQPTIEQQYQLGLKYYRGVGVTQDFKKAIECWEKIAEPSFWNRGHAASQVDLGVCYEDGTGVVKNNKKAFEYYELAAKQGNVRAQVNLGFCYKNGDGVSKDSKKAFEYFELAAKQGDALAQYHLGICYEDGIGVEINTKKAFEYYEFAAKQGNVSAQCTLGRCYKSGIGVAKDTKKAIEYYELAVKQKDEIAQFNLGNCYYEGIGVAKDVKKAFENYELAAEKGNMDAQFILGIGYKNGDGVSKDAKKAFEYFKLAAKQGHAIAQYRLGVCFAEGDGVTKDVKMACEYYQLAAKNGHAKAQYDMGLNFLNGFEIAGIVKDVKKAMEYFELSAKQGYAEAQFCLGYCYITGNGVAKNVEKAFEYFELAAKQGHEEARNRLELRKSFPTTNIPTATAASPITTTTLNTTSQTENNSFSLEQIQFLKTLHASGIKTTTLSTIPAQIERLNKQQKLLEQDHESSIAWIKTLAERDASIPTNAELKILLDAFNQTLQSNLIAKAEQDYINKQPKLIAYQQRLQQELCRFISCYYLAPAGVFKLEDDKKDLMISAISGAPIAGLFLKPLTACLSFINKKYRFLHINRLADLFKDTNHIVQVCCQFSREITLAKEKDIQQLVEVQYEGWRKIIKEIKETVEQQWQDLATADTTNLTIKAEDKLAIWDAAYLLQQIMSGDAKIVKEKELTAQFIEVLTRKAYLPAMTNTDVISTAIISVTPTKPNSLANTASSALPNSPTMEEMARELRFLKEKSEKNEQEKQEMNRALERQQAEHEKFKESLKDIGVSVGDGSQVQDLQPKTNSGKDRDGQITYLLKEHSVRLDQLAREVSILGETAVTQETVNAKVASAVKSAKANK